RRRSGSRRWPRSTRHSAKSCLQDRRHASAADAFTSPGSENGSSSVPFLEDFLPPGRRTLPTTLEALVSVLNERDIRYAIIGAIAVAYHGRARSTDDIDALLAVPQIAMPGLFEALRERGFDVDLPRNIHEFRDGGMT